jgi:hypothetical protein
MSRLGERQKLLALLALSAAVQLVFILTTDGDRFDIGNMVIVNHRLHDGALGLYGEVARAGDVVAYRWPYPPGFLPVILLVSKLANVLGGDVYEYLRVPGMLANLGIAWLVWIWFGDRGVSPRMRFAAAAAVALGPAFIADSAIHGQIDAVAVLPAVAGLVVWDKLEPGTRRTVLTGLLIGAGIAIKTVPIVALAAVLATVRSRREAVTLIVCALGPTVVTIAPFLLTHWHETVQAQKYHGLPGIGGISLLVQPHLAVEWLASGGVSFSHATNRLQDVSGVLAVASLVGTSLVIWRRRVAPALGASLLMLAVFAFGVNFLLTYAVLGLPFFLLAGWIRQVIAFQLVYLIPLAFKYVGYVDPGHLFSAGAVRWIYIPTMIGLWAVGLAVYTWYVVRLARNQLPAATH